MELLVDWVSLWNADPDYRYFLASWTGFFQEGLEDVGRQGSPFFDYIFTPLFSVTFFGLLPVLVVGFWFGSRIHKEGKSLVK